MGREAIPGELLREIASEMTGSRVLFSEPMANHTSFRIGGPCDLLVLPNSPSAAVCAWRLCHEVSVPCTIVGNGTNLLVKDGGVRGCVIKIAPGMSGIDRSGEDRLLARAGTPLNSLVNASLENELSGLEFAVGIPGSAGGAVAMNAGAYNGAFGSLVERVQVATLGGDILWLAGKGLDFSYRHSIFLFRDDLLILQVELLLSAGDKEGIRQVMQAHAAERQRKQPLDKPSAGSAFRRPPGRYVGAMLESLGLKGFSYGGAQVSPKHAGFIVNTGTATATDVLTLMEIVKEKVYQAFGVMLEPEIMVMGDDPVDADSPAGT